MKKIISVVLLGLFLFLLPAYAEDKEVKVILPRGAAFSDKTLYIQIQHIDCNSLNTLLDELSIFAYNKIVINLFSFGGSVFDALGMVGLLEAQQRQGKIIEIRARGIIASAGLIIMMSGDPGYRFIDKNAFVMFHEMWTFKLFAMESVSDQEEQARINRRIQDAINRYITTKSKISSEQLSEKIKKKELWCDAREAVSYGFADKIIGE